VLGARKTTDPSRRSGRRGRRAGTLVVDRRGYARSSSRAMRPG
jgi:hypothetical protein